MTNTTNTTKMTRVTAIEMAIKALDTLGTAESAQAIEKLTAIKTSIEKKNSTKSSKPTANQLANENIKAEILDVLNSATAPVTIAEMKALNADLAQYETSKLSQLLRQMYTPELSGGKPTVRRTEVKGKAYFESLSVIAEVDEDEEE